MPVTTSTAQDTRESLIATLLADDSFRPAEPDSLQEAGLPTSLVESLVCKILSVAGVSTGRTIAGKLCLPFGLLEPVFHDLRTRQIIVHTGTAALSDYSYNLTEQGRTRAQSYLEACGYIGAAPVPLADYVLSVAAQSIRSEAPKRAQLTEAFADISVNTDLFEDLGPAINSGAGLFLFGAPGNGKSTLARRITMCFGQHIWIPQALIEDGQIIKLFDSTYHEIIEGAADRLIRTANFDRRWVKIRRPTVVVGGELTMDGLEIRHDPRVNVSEAPLQLKSNCGCLLIDDFGRQRIEPAELLNRWIVPLENRVDFLTLSTGKKLQVPFEQLIIFSTNLEPSSLADEAFLRRIPYKVEIGDPDENEFHLLFELCAKTLDCEYESDAVEHLLEQHYRRCNRPLRRCHPRDLLSQIRNYCAYNDLPLEMRPEYFDRVARRYFTVLASHA